MITEKVNSQLKNEKAEEMALIQKELNKAKAEIEKIKRGKEKLKYSLEAENAKILNEKLAEEKDKIRKNEQSKK